MTFDQLISTNSLVQRRTAHALIADAQGNIIQHSVPGGANSNINISDRKAFKFHKDTNEDILYISPPVFGRVANEMTILLARALRSPSGEFEGVAMISLPLQSLYNSYKNLPLGVGGGVAIIGQDDVLRVGTGVFSSRVGEIYVPQKSTSSIPIRLIALDAPAINVDKHVSDGTHRLVATRFSDASSLSVIVAITNDVTSNFVSFHSVYFALAVLASALLSGATLLIRSADQQATKNLAQRNAMEVVKQVAEVAASDRGMFLAVMSHEIRTPLNGVLGALELMRDAKLDDRSQRCLNMAAENGEMLLKLIDDVLLFSKSDNDQISIMREHFSMQELCTSVHKSMLSMCIVGGNRFRLSLATEAPVRVIGDAPRIRQILNNLIGNANKFTKQGVITLSVETLAKTDETIYFRVGVRDTGMGIPKDKQEIIFNRFQTLDPSYTRRSDGTGLGLAICDKIIRAMDSEIELESKVGEGSYFFFDIRLDLAVENSTKVDDKERTPSEAAATQLDILITEDNPTNVYVVTEFLVDAGHVFQHAANGRAAVEMALAKRFDVMLMDISMPEMDGLQATQAIRSSDGPNRNTPIIALTAHTISGDEKKFRDVGMTGYVSKPIRRDLLLTALTSQTSTNRALQHSVASDGMSESPVLDRREFRAFAVERKVERVLKTIEIFTTELRSKIAQLEVIAESQDTQALQDFAHSTIGSGCLLGAKQLVLVSRRIEENCTKGPDFPHDAVRLLVKTIKNTSEEYERIRTQAAVNAYIMMGERAA